MCDHTVATKQQINKKSLCSLYYWLRKQQRKSKQDEEPGVFLNRSIGVITPHRGGGREEERKGLEDNTIYYAGR